MADFARIVAGGQDYEAPVCHKNAIGSCAYSIATAQAMAGTWLDISIGGEARMHLQVVQEQKRLPRPEELLATIHSSLVPAAERLRDLRLENNVGSEIPFSTFWFESALFLAGNSRPMIHAKANSALWLQVGQGFAYLLIIGVFLNEINQRITDRDSIGKNQE